MLLIAGNKGILVLYSKLCQYLYSVTYTKLLKLGSRIYLGFLKLFYAEKRVHIIRRNCEERLNWKPATIVALQSNVQLITHLHAQKQNKMTVIRRNDSRLT